MSVSAGPSSTSPVLTEINPFDGFQPEERQLVAGLTGGGTSCSAMFAPSTSGRWTATPATSCPSGQRSRLGSPLSMGSGWKRGPNTISPGDSGAAPRRTSCTTARGTGPRAVSGGIGLTLTFGASGASSARSATTRSGAESGSVRSRRSNCAPRGSPSPSRRPTPRPHSPTSGTAAGGGPRARLPLREVWNTAWNYHAEYGAGAASSGWDGSVGWARCHPST
jgi:hypothetical protein